MVIQSVSLTVKDYKSNIPVAILCGGKGTRLREETEFRPKPMIAIGNRPIIWHIMKTYAQYGLTDFMLCLGYKGEIIRDYFFNYDWNQSDVLLELGNKKVTKLDYVDQSGSDIFLATYGDGVCDVNIADLLDFHYSHGKLATLTAVRPPSRFGELVIEDNLVTQFQEKPQTAEGWINGGYFVLNRKVLDLIEGDATTFEAQPLRTLAALGELAVYKHEGFWQCMDTYREMEMLNHLYDTGQARWKIW